MNEHINSREYWEHRFETDWESNSGREQSRFFCRLAVENFPDWLVHAIRQQKLSVCDWGCAEGDGTDILAQVCGVASVTGVDFSETAIAKARTYYPRLHFLAENFLDSQSEQGFDIVFSSNTLEHFAEPWDVFAKIARRTKKFFILLVPYREFGRHKEHEVSFVAQNIPLSPCENWSLVYSRILNTGQLQPTYWPGEQILLLFARTQVLTSFGLTLDNACLNEESLVERSTKAEAEYISIKAARDTALAEREAAVMARDTALAQSTAMLAERDAALAQSTAMLAERDAALAERDAALAERDAALAERDAALVERDAALVERDAALVERDVAVMARDTAVQYERLVQELQAQVEQQRHALQTAQAHTAEITHGIGWAMLRTMWRWRLRLAPNGSRRERLLRLGFVALRTWKKEGVRVVLQRAMHCIGRHTLPARMSWYAYAFWAFKRARQTFSSAHFTAVRCPEQRGLVSIVLPVYNGAAFLTEALASIQQQTYRNFELIVVDDGSTDTTPDILAAHAQHEPRMRLIRQDNQRLPRALSNGFQVARGEFLTWTSADNWLKPNFLEQMVQCLQRHPQWDMIYANEDIIDNDGRPLRQSSWFAHYQTPAGSEHIFLPTDPAELNTWANNYIGGAFMYRRRVPFLIGDYSPWRFGTEDYDYWMRVNALLTLRHADFDAPVYDYRFHDDSLTSQDKALGITKNRPYLMIFDDFRRDFYLSPLVWCIDGDNASTQVDQLTARLEQHIHAAGHVILPLERWQPAEFPRLWCPAVYVKVVTEPGYAHIPPAFLSEATLKVLVVTGNTPLPAVMDATWDVCVANMPQESLPFLAKAWQGWLGIAESEMLFAVLDTRARSHHLTFIEAEIASPAPPQYKLSVIICTYRRSNRLLQAIRSVAQQTLAQQEYEVIIVNNDLADVQTAQVVAALRQEHFVHYPEHLRFLTCPLVGLSHARNAGIAAAHGEVVCFLDDDAIASPDWLEQVWSAFQDHPEAGVVGGKILLKLPDPQPWWLHAGWWPFWSHFAPEYEHYTTVHHWWEFPWGANWTARRTALLQIGGFRARYGRKANDYGGGEELIAARLIQQIDYTVAVAPQSQVEHDVEPGRFTLWHVWRTMLSATHVIYQAQRDLYLPMESSPQQSLYRTCRAVLASVLQLRLSPLERVEKMARGAVELSLFWRQLRDRFLRCRKSLSIP